MLIGENSCHSDNKIASKKKKKNGEINIFHKSLLLYLLVTDYTEPLIRLTRVDFNEHPVQMCLANVVHIFTLL